MRRNFVLKSPRRASWHSITVECLCCAVWNFLPLIIYVSKQKKNNNKQLSISKWFHWTRPMNEQLCMQYTAALTRTTQPTRSHEWMQRWRGKRGGTTVGGSGCDLDTVWHTAFLMGHFDHCHSLYPPLLLLLPAILKHKDSANTATQTLLRSFLMMAAVNLAVETPQSERRCEFWRCCTQKKNKKTTDVNKLFFLLWLLLCTAF